MRVILFALMAVTFLAMICGAASADVIFDPPWDRPTEPGSPDPNDLGCHYKTYQQFEFSQQPDPRYGGNFWCTDPEVSVNARGRGRSQYFWDGTGEPPMYWNDQYAGRQGVFTSVEKIDIWVPNFPEDWDRTKLIWLQITYYKDAAEGAVPNNAWASPQYSEQTVEFGDVYDQGDGWYTQVIFIDMAMNPWDDWIMVTFDGEGIVDEVVVDTWCAPEPASLSLIVLGGLALLRRRRDA